MPPPDPRSSTVSPARSSASAVGLPQPKDAATASFGRSAISRPAYRLDVITSPPPPSVPQPQALPQQPSPAEARRAAFAYFSRTTSLMSAASGISPPPRPYDVVVARRAARRVPYRRLGDRPTQAISFGLTAALRVQHSAYKNPNSSRSVSAPAAYRRNVPSRRTVTRPS